MLVEVDERAILLLLRLRICPFLVILGYSSRIEAGVRVYNSCWRVDVRLTAVAAHGGSALVTGGTQREYTAEIDTKADNRWYRNVRSFGLANEMP